MPRSAPMGLLLWLAFLATAPAALPAQSPGPAEGTATGPLPPMQTGQHCMDCHEGIEVINPTMDRLWGAHRNCVVCHKGVPAARTMEDAHQGLIAKPGDLRVVMDTCGTCHSQFGMGAGLTTGPAHDVVDRVLRSPMALATGEIAAVRYLWGEQVSPIARYGVRSVSALPGPAAEGTVPAVAELPHPRNSLADHVLRTRCLQCHLWTAPAAGTPPFRGAGCAACHVAYAPDGRSRSGDRTISKLEPGHPRTHRIERYVKDAQCLTCHRDEGLGIGWNFAGWLSQTPGESAQPAVGGGGVLPVPPDVHAAAGMACIDCHDTWDMHGDGQVHSRGRTAVGIRCITCHGTPTAAPTFTTTRGHPLPNVEVRDGVAVLVGKLDGTVWTIPRLDRDDGTGTAPAHRIAAHLTPEPGRPGLTCVACHAGTVQQHFLRAFKLDERQAVPYDWGTGLSDRAASPVTQGRWTVRSTWSPTGLPMLGLNVAGQVDALVASFHTLRWVTDTAGRTIESGQMLQTLDGRYGVGFRTVDPHRTQAEGRACASCHGDPATLGLGSARIDPVRLQWPLRYAPDQVADAEGTPIAAFSTPGERPLNYEELVRTLRRPACADCHTETPSSAELPPDHTPVGADLAHRRRVRRRGLAAPAPDATPVSNDTATATPAQQGDTEDATIRATVAPTSAIGREHVAPRPEGNEDKTRAPELSPFIGR